MQSGNLKDVIDKYCVYLTEKKQVSKATLSAYKTDMNKFRKFAFEKYHIDLFSDINVSILTSYMLHMKSLGLKGSSISRSSSVLKNLMLYAYHESYIDENLAEVKLELPKEAKELPEILTVSEMDLLLSQPEDTVLGIRDRAMLETLYTSGLKVNELINLKLEDLDLKLKVIKCRSKSKTRVLPLGAIALEAIESYLSKSRLSLDKSDCEYLFLSYNGHQISRQGFWKVVKKYGDQAGIKKNITTSTFRHSFATHMIQNGIEKDALRQTLGNSSVASVQVYLDLNRKRKRS
ncbi:site-specific tyrosine recombinase XerD [Acidaminobacter sp. JC074]|uniref:tyrosine-type recombinase/integrase n=1 Tax=Acidaminobacter sp. JC074 TaxID=2530199 RepID=UPI001F0DC29A|nr:tyrosine-type recombinase/integrase [Acidaminobacter sp. JC074]MCH4888833.1 site-specific tyrosine recombinase XerD [Acidaminobacter sp. JC074]